MQAMSDKYLESFPVVIDLNVAWGEMDSYQHVNNTVYFRYFESARIVYLERIDFADRLKNDGIGPILGHTQCKYLKPLTFPDSICVGARTTEIRDDRYIMELKIYSHRHEAIAALGTADMVAFDYNDNCKVQLPCRYAKTSKCWKEKFFKTSCYG